MTSYLIKSFEELDCLGVGLKCYYSLLPLGCVSEVNAESLGLLLHVNCVYRENLNLEHLLNRTSDFGLCSVLSNINVYDILNADKFIVSKAAVEKLEEVFA